MIREARTPRHGTLAIELLIVLPLLLTVLLAGVEFSLLLVAQQQVVVASREGARVAAQGGAADDVQAAVQKFLGQGPLSQASVTATLTDDHGQPIPAGGSVSVTVSIAATQAVPDMLAYVGISLSNQSLVGRTVMRKE